MGHRANLVICKNQDWQLYYDHWCAIRLDTELFWGPELAAAFIEQRNPIPNRTDWLDDIWCEGGAVLDLDHQVLLWFGGEIIPYDLSLRKAFFSLMRPQWPGWSLEWASGGITDLGAYVDVPSDKLLNSVPLDDVNPIQIISDNPDANYMLITIRENNLTLASQANGSHDALALGSSQLDKILSFPRNSRVEWENQMPSGGLHIDLDSYTLSYWFVNPHSDNQRISEKWPGWQCINLRDRLEDHLELTGMVEVRWPDPDIIELQQTIINQIRKDFGKPPSNPAQDLLSKLGETAQLNPWTNETRGPHGSQVYKLHLLDEIEKRIPILD